MLVIKNYIFPCIFCTIVFFSDLVAVQGQTKTGEITYDGPPFVMIGNSFNITCRVYGELEWHKDGKPINAIRANGYVEPKKRQQDGYTIGTLTVSEAKDSHAGAYKCNSFSNRIIYINVTRPQALAQLDDANTNSVINATQDAILKEGKELQLECNFSINSEETNFRWQFEGKDINVTQKASATKKTKYVHPKTGSSILIIRNTNASTDAGVYTCKVNNTSYDNSKNISVWSIPAFLKMHTSLNKVEGDSVFLTCRAYGLPLPEIWWGKESGVLEDNERIKTTNGSNNATLEIKDLVSEDRDNYICYALNNATNDTQQLVVLIRVKDKLAALWPFLGICAEVAILCTIIFIYEKRRSKEELEEEEPNQEEKTVSNSNQKDKDIRQRK